MLDAHLRPWIDPSLNWLGKTLAQRGISANAITLSGFAVGLLAIPFIFYHHYWLALILILINRLFDGIDGGIARQTQLSDFGGFLDIVCDFIFYSAIVFAFALSRPHEALWGVFLVFSFIGPITSFLAYAIIAAKRQHTTTARGKKSFYHLGGICEGTETMFILLLMCIAPEFFSVICLVYGILCWITTLGRVMQAKQDFYPNQP
jgi:phosphatidylglycerophosphate synthase